MASRPRLQFESMKEKLDTIKAFNDILRASGLPAVHEGLDQRSVHFNIWMCISETPVEEPEHG